MRYFSAIAECQIYLIWLFSKTVNQGGWVKKEQKCVNVVCEQPLNLSFIAH